MSLFDVDGAALVVRHLHEIVRIEPWGTDSVRVRAAQHRLPSTDVGALTTAQESGGEQGIEVDTDSARLVNGQITVEVTLPDTVGTPVPMLRFLRTSTGRELLAEDREHFWWPGPRVYYGNRSGAQEIHQQFRAYQGERLYGMGQRTHGRLDHKNLALDLVQRNGEVSIPFVLSNRGYGMLWNNPAVGRVEFADNATRWTSSQARGVDYFMTAGSPRQILARYADATGHAPRLPRWASGFWQSKLRYRSQEELLEVAREYHRRELPLSVIVTDFFHWTAMGDFRFDPAEYPDPRAMMRELNELGVHLMVSVWPTVSPLSENYETLHRGGMLLGTDQGLEFHAKIRDKGMDVAMPVTFYDPTNPHTRDYIWSLVKRHYYDLGVRVWWLDACEPEISPGHPGNLSLFAGPGAQVASIYPRDNARLFAEGMTRAAEESGSPDDAETVLLCRSAWAGQQRYGAALWSGDIPATWQSLQQQVRAGLSIAIAGIPWWTTDIGGFFGGDPDDPDYRELVVRWFQYGAFCPLFRLHGVRQLSATRAAANPRGTDVAEDGESSEQPAGWEETGGPNEVWSYGQEAYTIIKDTILMRERLRPYLHEHMDLAAEQGLPVMRPLFVDFPHDERAWTVEDQMMFGPDLLVAPVTGPGLRARPVYLPEGAAWTHAWTGRRHQGGTMIEEEAPLHQIPVYLRDDAAVPVAHH